MKLKKKEYCLLFAKYKNLYTKYCIKILGRNTKFTHSKRYKEIDKKFEFVCKL